jgi:Delta3-Delta2-enoyl-CoA isomerase
MDFRSKPMHRLRNDPRTGTVAPVPYLERTDSVFVMYLGDESGGDTENRFHPDWIRQVHALLDEVEAFDGPTALVTTATGKYYSTGADVAWGAENPGRIDEYLSDIQLLLARLLTFPVPTVAALQGHTFGAGAFLAITHDYVTMRDDRGFLCFPGITLGVSYSPGTIALTSARLPERAAHDALTTGRRYGGVDALAIGLVNEVAGEAELLPNAIRHAASLAHTRGHILAEIKEGLYHQALTGLREPVRGVEDKLGDSNVGKAASGS